MSASRPAKVRSATAAAAHLTWADAVAAVAGLTPASCRILQLLGRLPLLPAGTLRQLEGLDGPAAAYRTLGRLRDAGLAVAIKIPVDRGGAAGLWHPTDLGVAALALGCGADPTTLARLAGLRRADLAANLRRLPALLALYSLVAGLAAAGPGLPQLTAWARPWARAWHDPRRGRAVSLHFPAGVDLAWSIARTGHDGEADRDMAWHGASYALLPDLGVLPPRAWRTAVGRFLAYHRASQAARTSAAPTLVIAADVARLPAWESMLDDLARRAGWPNWRATGALALLDRAALTAGRAAAPAVATGVPPDDVAPEAPHATDAPRRPIPRPVGAPLAVATPAFALTPDDWWLLDLIARHPFLPLAGAAMALGWGEGEVRRRRRRLRDLGLVRPLGRRDLGRAWANRAALELAEATVAGLRAVAGRHDLALGVAVARLGLAGGGPETPVGQRTILLHNLAHTLGADAVFVAFHAGAASARRAGGPDDEALVAWECGAACTQGPIQPDGYGVYRRAGRRAGFFLEYDRGMAGMPALARKFGTYGRWHDRGRWRHDYDGFPTILVVTEARSVPREVGQSREVWRAVQADAQVAAVERVVAAVQRAEAARVAARVAPLPVLLTTTGLIQGDRSGVLGAIWSAPTAVRDRRHWLSWDHESRPPG